ncbi:aldehyde dehydrogenase family protein, partial [Pseudomonas aeruginosa]|uniref:aldehyde dehydrogenase family protein n=1 Tax=Pseudomonas aeruginosa TaxID=287 RepID=UPI000FD259EE
MKEIKHFISGAFVGSASGKLFDNVSPANGLVIGRVHEAGRAEVDAAVRAARAALKGPWGKMTVAERAEILHRVADGITARFDEFLEAECLDTGKPKSLASHIDIPRGAANFKVFADLLKNVANEAFEMATPDGAGALNYGAR